MSKYLLNKHGKQLSGKLNSQTFAQCNNIYFKAVKEVVLINEIKSLTMYNSVILHGVKVPLAVWFPDLLTGDAMVSQGLQLFPVLILNQCAQTRVERYFTFQSAAPKAPGRSGG